ncbi:MAG: adenosylcobinamide-phosphate synthase CbiB [Pseudomonadota bacterium]
MLVCALILDAVFGEPAALWRRVPHPVVVFGRMIRWLEIKMNRGSARRLKGTVALLLLVAAAALAGALLAHPALAGVGEVAVAAILLAHRSLIDHVQAVARALTVSLQEGRATVSQIVGRDTTELDESGVARAAIESAAENFSDGVVAPAFWFLVAGLPGIVIYKMVNTADSMIGYRTERFLAFGWASARLDDLMNWIPARLSGALICLIGGGPAVWRIMWRDARLHRSPNAGWPEAALAPCLGIALSGPRVYDGRLVDDPFVHKQGRIDLTAADIDRACTILWNAWVVLVILAGAAFVAGTGSGAGP